MMCRKPLVSLGLAAALALPLAITAGRLFAADGAGPATEPSAVASPAIPSDAAPVAAMPAGNADLLKQGNDQLNNRQYDDALVTFQLIDLKSLSDADRATVVDGLTKSKAGAIERREALAEYNRGELSRGSNNLADAQQHYTAALNNAGI